MTRQIDLTQRDERMLELLAGGISNKAIARKMGYAEGTMRVYLHDLYRKLGVDNKTAAVVWHFARSRARAGAAGSGPSVAGPANNESFGDFALRTSLHGALGAYNMFLGPFGRVWEVAARLKGKAGEPGTEARRRAARNLWEALLRAEATPTGKAAIPPPGSTDSATELVLRSALLLVTGQAAAARTAIERLAVRRKGMVPEGERTLVLALRDALAGSDEGLACLYQRATGKSSALERQLAVVSLFHAYRARHDADRARDTANAICAMAEDARAHLQAMGERPLFRSSEVPEPANASSRSLAAYLRKLGKARVATA